MRRSGLEMQEADRKDAEERGKRGLASRILESIVTGFQIMRERKVAPLSAEEQAGLLKRGIYSFQDDAFFHAVASMVFNEIKRDIEIGEPGVRGSGDTTPGELLQKLTEWEALDKAATPGPWWAGDGTQVSHFNGNYAVLAKSESECTACVLLECNVNFKEQADADGRFIAATRTALPEAIKEIRRLQAELARLQTLAERA